MLFSQGFRTAESLASKIVPFFNLCDEQLSPQPHYDFGLRALKAVLASAGILKRERLQSARAEGEGDDVGVLSDTISEQIILIQSVTETIVPKLVADDVPLLTKLVSFNSLLSSPILTVFSLLADVFPGVDYMPVDLDAFGTILRRRRTRERSPESIEHIMDFTTTRALNTPFSLINKTVRNVIEYDLQHPDFPLPPERVEQYVTKRLLVNIIWAFSGDAKLDLRAEMGDYLRKQTGIDLPPLSAGDSLIDYDVQVSNSEWTSWQSRVPVIEIESPALMVADVVVPTMDTVRHEEVLFLWLSEHKPLVLCGPPGSGKTMTLFSALRKLPDMEVVGLYFSSATTPELILKTFEQYCEYRKTPNGVILAPVQISCWVVVFCDEINLPAADKYGTQRVISYIPPTC